MILPTAAEMRALDRWTIAHHTPGHVLMERAGAGATAVLLKHWRTRRGPIVIVCGRGNNGGDGFVMARRLKRARRTVQVWLTSPADTVAGDARRMLDAWRKGGGRIESLQTPADLVRFQRCLARAAVIVDALLGTGLNAPVSDHLAGVVDAINGATAPVLAVDIASGLSADSGQPLGTAIRADVTATFAYPKLGQCLYPAIDLGGQLEVVDIGIPIAALDAVGPRARRLDPDAVRPLLPPRRADSHKGTYGHVLVIAGAPGTTGAALLATEGAARGGAGLTTVAGPTTLQPVLALRVLEAMTAAVPDEIDDTNIDAFLAGFTAVVCGPGLGSTDHTRALVAAVVRRCRVPLVLDADALNAIAGTIWLRERPAATIVTPHPGEMARLLRTETATLQADRPSAARRFAAAEGVITVLKGARTIIAAPDGRLAVNPTGNPGMASGGMGDVLAGLIGGLLAQRLDPYDAACLGTYVHGAAADAVSHRRGTVGMLARDVLDAIPAAIHAVQSPAARP